MTSIDDTNSRLPLTRQAHEFIGASIRPGSLAIDATAGNGHDLEFLCRLVGPGGLVYAFDVQAGALERARRRLAERGLESTARFVHSGHQEMVRHVEPAHRGIICAIMFNLGYLPGGDHGITTHVETTLVALDIALELLTPGGRLTVLCYPGHPAGREETLRVDAWQENLPARHWSTTVIESYDPGNGTPWLLSLEKLPGITPRA